jgi:hypothetical protein
MYRAGNSVEQVFGGTVIKQGDRTPLGFNFRTENGELVDLTGSAVQVKVASDKGVVLEKQATISDEYTVQFAIGSQDITGAGNMRIEFIVTYPGGTIEKFPSDDWQRIRITPTLEDVEKYGVGYITFEKLTEEFQNQFDEFKGDVDQQIDYQKQRVDNLIKSTPQPSEVVDARFDESGNVFTTVKAHLDDKGRRITLNEKNINFLIRNSEYFMDSGNIDPTGKINSSAAIQEMWDSIASSGGAKLKVPKGVYRIESPLKYYPDKISLEASRDAVFLCTQSTGYAIEIQSYDTLSVKDYLDQAFRREIKGIKFVATNPNIFLVRSKGDLLGKFAAGWTFYRCSFIGASAIEINNDTWAVNIQNCYLRPTVNGAGYGIYMPSGGTNYGEKISITNNTVIDEAKLAIYNGNGEGDIRVEQTSIDYCRQAVVVNRGIVSLDNVFIESDSSLTHWFEVDGYAAHLEIGNIEITDKVKTRTAEIFRIADDSSDIFLGSGITADSIKLISGESSLPFLVKGNGRVSIKRLDTYREAKKSLVARFMNLLAFGNCDTSNSIDEWDNHRYTTVRPILDSNEKYEGTGSMKFSVSTSGYSVGAQATFPCSAGQIPRVKFHIKTANLQTNGKTFVTEWRFLNKKGAAIKTGTGKTFNTDYSSWTEFFYVLSTQAPPGTTSVEISFFGNAWTLDCAAWIDDIVINIT